MYHEMHQMENHIINADLYCNKTNYSNANQIGTAVCVSCVKE